MNNRHLGNTELNVAVRIRSSEIDDFHIIVLLYKQTVGVDKSVIGA